MLFGPGTDDSIPDTIINVRVGDRRWQRMMARQRAAQFNHGLNVVQAGVFGAGLIREAAAVGAFGIVGQEALNAYNEVKGVLQNARDIVNRLTEPNEFETPAKKQKIEETKSNDKGEKRKEYRS